MFLKGMMKHATASEKKCISHNFCYNYCYRFDLKHTVL